MAPVFNLNLRHMFPIPSPPLLNKSIKTFTELWVNVFEPTVNMFSMFDIAHALSNMPRFAGHTPVHYSVAQHSLGVAKLVETNHGGKYSDWALEALMHDASEAYMMDLPSPIKHDMVQYMEVEDGLMKVIFEAFHLKHPYDHIVKLMDEAHTQMEMSHSFVFPRVTHEEIELEFLKEYSRLLNKRLDDKREYLKLSKI